VEALKALAPSIGMSRILTLLKFSGEAESQMRFSSNPLLALELFLVRLGSFQPQGSLGELYDELAVLEKRLNSGAPIPLSAPSVGAALARPSSVQEPAPPATPGVIDHTVEEIAEAPKEALLNLERVKQDWEKVVERAAEANLMLGTCVRDAELAGLASGELVLRTRNPKQKETIEAPDNRHKLEAALSEVFGQSLKLKVLYSAPSARPAPAAAAAPQGGAPSPEELARLHKEMPQLKKFQDLFDAEIIDIKKS